MWQHRAHPDRRAQAHTIAYAPEDVEPPNVERRDFLAGCVTEATEATIFFQLAVAGHARFGACADASVRATARQASRFVLQLELAAI